MKKQNGKIGYAILKSGAQILAAVAFLLFAWWIAYLWADNELIIPALPDCLIKAWHFLGDGWFWQCFFATFLRVIFAFSVSFVFAAIFAVVAYLVPSFAKFFTPIASGLRSLPVLAVTLILLIVFGAGGAPIAVAFLSLFPMLYTGILAALSGISKDLLNANKVCGVTVKNSVFRVFLPLSAPYIVREGVAAFSFALKLVVSAEVVASTAKSLGGMMKDAQAYMELPQLFALVIVTFLVALVLETVGGVLADCVDKAQL